MGVLNREPLLNRFLIRGYVLFAAPIKANLKKCNIYSDDLTRPRLVVNLKEIFEDKDRRQDVELQANDTILLERRSGFIVADWSEIAQIFSVIFGAASIYLVAQNAR